MKKIFIILLLCINAICYGNEKITQVNSGTVFTNWDERNNLVFCLMNNGVIKELYKVESANFWHIYTDSEKLVYLISQTEDYMKTNKLLLFDFKSGIKHELAEEVISYNLSETGIAYYLKESNEKNRYCLNQFDSKTNMHKSLDIDLRKYFDYEGFYVINICFKDNFIWLFFYEDASEFMKIRIDKELNIIKIYEALYDEKSQQNYYQYENGEIEFIKIFQYQSKVIISVTKRII